MRAVHSSFLTKETQNHNCRGCGALIIKHVCPYCGRSVSAGDVISRPDQTDPKAKAELRKTQA